jgi:histidinol phosphatase-like enzyme
VTTDPCYIFDLDGTIANDSHRGIFLATEPKNWDAYYNLVEDDRPIHATIEIIKALTLFQYGIIGLTARTERVRPQTEKWLASYNIKMHKLFMRAENDFRADDVVKEEILDTQILPYHDVVGVFEDRKRVIDMYIRRKIFVFDVSQGRGNF